MSAQKLEIYKVGKLSLYFRPNSSDEAALKEVIYRAAYRRKAYKFDVLPGEHWLDLGANIGSFAAYCALQGATATCYEPDPDCFAILKKNIGKLKGFTLINAAVSAHKAKTLGLHRSPRTGDFYRNTLMDRKTYKETVEIANVYAGTVFKQKFDGCKMDIEGSEGPIFDAGLVPNAPKLAMEYHSSVDDLIENYLRRAAFLKTKFKNLPSTREFERMKERGYTNYKPFADRLMFAWK